MINRILIRIKVVQLLYSYLLTRSEFRILPEPEKKTRDSRYAYTLYIQTLLLVLKFSGQRVSSSDSVALNLSAKNPLEEVGRALAANNDLREVATKRDINIDSFLTILQYLYNKIQESAVYAEYSRKRKRDIEEEVNVWTILIESLLAKDERFKEICRRNEDFTIAGFERGLKMAVDTLRDYSDIKSTLQGARRSLKESLDKARQLYIALLMLPAEITRMREEQLELARDKYLPSADDLNPNLKFINNCFVEAVCRCEEFDKFRGEPIISAAQDNYLIRKLLEKILESDIYKSYMSEAGSSASSDCEFWRVVMKDIVFQSDEFAEALENKSIYWNDDLMIVGTFVLKTIRRAADTAAEGRLTLLPAYKDDEDAIFGEQLFTYSVNNYKYYRELIDKFINPEQWDSERLALMDIVIMTAALAEILNFPLIPIPVSLNEYIEIANYYSTARSGHFINGILYSVLNYLKNEGKLPKEF